MSFGEPASRSCLAEVRNRKGTEGGLEPAFSSIVEEISLELELELGPEFKVHWDWNFNLTGTGI